jgi:hypothetical protein
VAAFDNPQLLAQQHDLNIFFPITHSMDECQVQYEGPEAQQPLKDHRCLAVKYS